MIGVQEIAASLHVSKIFEDTPFLCYTRKSYHWSSERKKYVIVMYVQLGILSTNFIHDIEKKFVLGATNINARKITFYFNILAISMRTLN